MGKPGAAPLIIAAALIGSPLIPTALADPPPGFPDLTQYTEVPADRYATELGIPGNALFGTPDGLTCQLRVGGGTCGGPDLPGFPAAQARPARPGDSCGNQNVTFGPDPGNFWVGGFCNGAGAHPLLAPGQKLTIPATSDAPAQTCVVGADRLTACTDGTHGFVLQPSGAWAF